MISCAMKTLKLLAVSVVAAIAAACASEENEVIVVHPHEAEPSDCRGCTRVFLAGTIDMGSSEDWQAEAAELLKQMPGSFIVYNPRQKEWHPEIEGEIDYQVNWELEHLEKADIILMNFLPDSKSPITLLELGLHARSGKLRVICPQEFYRYDNVRITCKRYGVPMFSNLSDALLE